MHDDRVHARKGKSPMNTSVKRLPRKSGDRPAKTWEVHLTVLTDTEELKWSVENASSLNEAKEILKKWLDIPHLNLAHDGWIEYVSRTMKLRAEDLERNPKSI
jgi:hypothetical protein